MLFLASFDIVFQEIPGEVTLALNLSDCPNACPGCHSPHLQQTVGEPLTEELLGGLLDRYGAQVSCVAFMGGDRDIDSLNFFAERIRTRGDLKTAWYTGGSEVPQKLKVRSFDFIKVGPYIENLGGLTSPTTNQRFYRIDENQDIIDETAKFHKN